MSENKRYFSIDYDEEYYIFDSTEIENLLNEQDKRIKELEKENEGIQNKVWDLIDYLELKYGIDKKEVKEYWNNGDGEISRICKGDKK